MLDMRNTNNLPSSERESERKDDCNRDCAEMKYLPSFGRKRARGLSETQKNNLVHLYKTYGIEISEKKVSLETLFNTSFEKIFVEVGFGHGEHLIQNAIQNPKIGFIGCEPFENGVAATLKEIQVNNLQNVRIYKGDARLLLEKFPKGTIDRVYVLFPDPWHKKRHHKRRILSAEFIDNLRKNRTKELVVATDCKEYMESVLENLRQLKIPAPNDIETLSQKPDWFLSTRYEQKALSKGSKCYYLKIDLR
ncbi:MAG: tRNA (guanosine(46)-N7)-methyltransferase TrmB [Alphaproteobacteria bacterium]|nr:tRNA (guanosine(46)-N7)-methyltransferase TrmB [Alphaproteobacteria bacterium]